MAPQDPDKKRSAAQRGDRTDRQFRRRNHDARNQIGGGGERRAAENRRRQQQTMVRSEQAAQDVRHDEADERDDAADGYRRPDHDRGGDKDEAAHERYIDAKFMSVVVAEAQQVHFVRLSEQHGKTRHTDDRDEADLAVGGSFEAAHQPENNAVGEEEVDHAVDQHDGRGPDRIEDHADQQQRERFEPAFDLRQTIDRGRRRQRSGKGRHRDDQVNRRDVREEYGRSDGTQRPTAGDAEDAALGQRIAHQRLERHTHRRENPADDEANQDARDAHTDENRAIGTGGVSEGPGQVDMHAAAGDRDAGNDHRDRAQPAGRREHPAARRTDADTT